MSWAGFAMESCVKPEPFHERVDAVRRRFAASLDGKIKDTFAELAELRGEEASAIAAVAACYRRIHGICGIGAAIGFAGTGSAAKSVEDILVAAYRAGRGLNSAEAAQLPLRLDALAAAAAAELRDAEIPAQQ